MHVNRYYRGLGGIEVIVESGGDFEWLAINVNAHSDDAPDYSTLLRSEQS
jgi:hypothetical protein